MDLRTASHHHYYHSPTSWQTVQIRRSTIRSGRWHVAAQCWTWSWNRQWHRGHPTHTLRAGPVWKGLWQDRSQDSILNGMILDKSPNLSEPDLQLASSQKKGRPHLKMSKNLPHVHIHLPARSRTGPAQMLKGSLLNYPPINKTVFTVSTNRHGSGLLLKLCLTGFMGSRGIINPAGVYQVWPGIYHQHFNEIAKSAKEAKITLPTNSFAVLMED